MSDRAVLPRYASRVVADLVEPAEYEGRPDDDDKLRFLELIVGGNSQHRAASQLGLPVMLFIRARHTDPQFADDLAMAMDARRDALEEVAVDRAVNGTKTMVFNKEGEHTGDKTEYGSHALLQFLLKAYSPKFRDRIEQTVKTEQAPNLVVTDADARKLLARTRSELPVIEGELVDKSTDDVSDLL